MENQKQPKKIVVVEDNVDYAQLLERVLLKAGYAVKLFTDPKNVLESIFAEKPDLVILDIMLPETSGLSILEDIKKRDTDGKIPVFCLTNLPEEVGREKALSLGAYSYLTKSHYNIYDILKHIDLYFKEGAQSGNQ